MEKCSVGGCPQSWRVQVAKELEDDVLSLEFCGHHYNVHRAVLLLDGFEVIEDHREKGQVFER